ncbi:MAG: secretin and TonB N-terminal domain-containing protein [Betaproteobacteria bacterium]
MTSSRNENEDNRVMPAFSLHSRCCTVLLLVIAIGGCATNQSFREAKDLIGAGQTDEGMARLQQLVADNPTNAEYKAYYLRQQETRATRLVVQGHTALINDDFAGAEAAFNQALAIDRNNSRASIGLRMLEDARRHQALLQRAEARAPVDAEEALALVRMVLSENPNHAGANRLKRRIEAERHQDQLLPPKLTSNLKKPITLQFRDASLSEVFQALAQVSGMSFIFDKDVPATTKVTLFANGMSVEDALNVLLTTSQLDKKILGENALLIYPNNPTKKADYQENIVKSFYIGNADPKQTMNMVKTLARSRDVFIDEKLGLLTVRDSLDNIRIIEKLIAAQDLQESEVMLEVEVLEVSTARLQNLGIQYPGQIALTPFSTNQNLLGGSVAVATAGGVGTTTPGNYVRGITTLRDLAHLTSNKTLANIGDPGVIIDLKAQDGITNLLANPRIRVKSREKAKIRIGDKVPVITTTTASTGVSTESVQYLDVGLALDVDPIVHPDNQVSMKLALEVSSVAREVTSKSGLLTYQIGTRRAETVLRLKDGETQVLAGLIKREERDAANKIPGLGDLPILGRLFGSKSENLEKTEIVLLVTPRIVRRTELPPVHITEFSAGSDNYASITPLRLQPSAKLMLPGAGAAPAAAPAPAATAPQMPPQGAQPPAGNAQPPSDSGTVVTFALDAPQRVSIQQPVELRINAMLKQDVKLINLEIDFDPNKLEFAAGDVGPLMGSSGGTPQLETRVEAPGRLRFIIQNTGGARGTGQLGTLVFKPKAPSSEPVFIGFGGIFALDVAGNQVTILSPDPRPVIITP